MTLRNLTALIIVTIVVFISGVFFLNQKGSDVPAVSSRPTPSKSSDIVNIESESQALLSEVRSPDGKVALTMGAIKSGDSTTYTFSVSNTPNGIQRQVFSKTVLSGTTMDLPPNAWSPDNKYFFIIEKNANSTNYFVFRSDGEYFSESEQYIDVTPRFISANTGYTFSEVTGWDSETLLHVYTIKEDGARGASFWFEIPSKAVIQLASR